MSSERRRTSSDGSSLGSMARHFVEYVRRQPDGLVDLNEASKQLNARKRRVYDVTNVLEGVELLEKTSKNIVQWISPTPVSSPNSLRDIDALKKDIQKLEASLRETDSSIQAVYKDLRALQDNEGDRLYIDPEDVKEIKALDTKQCFLIKMPSDAQTWDTLLSDGVHRFEAACKEGEIVVLDVSKSKSEAERKLSSPDESSKENRTKRRSSPSS